MAVTQTITNIPTPPQSTDPANFIARADAFVSALDTMQPELNTAFGQINTTETNMNALEVSASASAVAAVAAANFKGNWSSAISYAIGDSVLSSGVIYRAILSGSNQNPSTATTYWVALSVASSIKNTPAGTISSTTVQAALNELATEKAPLASPTFTGNPTAPTQTAGDNSTKVATTAFTKAEITAMVSGTNVSLSSSGYQKLPSGLILQWGLTGTTADGGTAVTVTFPIAFPTAVYHVSYMKIGSINVSGNGDDRIGTVTLTNFLANAGTITGDNYFFAIGA